MKEDFTILSEFEFDVNVTGEYNHHLKQYQKIAKIIANHPIQENILSYYIVDNNILAA